MKMFQYRRRAPHLRPVQIFVAWDIVRNLLALWVKLQYRNKVIGKDRVPKSGPLVFVVNHQSHLDPILVGAAVGDRPYAALARSSLFRFRFFGWFIRFCGTIPLERDKSDRAAMKEALNELKKGACVFVFPEGTRTPDGSLQEFKHGVILLLKRSGAPAVPVAVEGAYDVWPRGRSRPKSTGRMAVMVGPVIDNTELLEDGPAAAAERLRRTIETMRMTLREDLRRASGGRYPPPGPADRPYWEQDPVSDEAASPHYA